MNEQTVVSMLEHEHRAIDQAIERFTGNTLPAATFRESLDLLRRHIYVEETMMFPQLRAAGMIPPILVMEREHGEIWGLLDTLDAGPDGADSGPEADVVRDTCQQLTLLLANHNAKEEPIVYPAADATLSVTEAARIKEFLTSGTMPEGWTCARAS